MSTALACIWQVGVVVSKYLSFCCFVFLTFVDYSLPLIVSIVNR